jgi:hypothetical protein
MSFPGISFSTWNADPRMRRIVSRNSSPMEAGESCKKVYRNYLNYSWPAGSLPSSAWPGSPSVCERQIGAITCSSFLTTVKRLLDGHLLLSPLIPESTREKNVLVPRFFLPFSLLDVP